MKITAGTLFLAVAVFLDSIDLISSVEPVQTTLAQLFPEYQQTGYLPPAQLNTNHAIIRTTTFKQIGNHILLCPDHEPPFLARGHVIFAWRGDNRNFATDRQGDYIEPLWQLFQRLIEPKRWVFDTTGNRWVTLIQHEFDKLGFDYNWILVQVQQQIALTHRRTTGNPAVDARAHHIAYSRANQAMDMLQATEAKKIYNRETSVATSAMLITTRYQEAYKMVFYEIARDSG